MEVMYSLMIYMVFMLTSNKQEEYDTTKNLQMRYSSAVCSSANEHLDIVQSLVEQMLITHLSIIRRL